MERTLMVLIELENVTDFYGMTVLFRSGLVFLAVSGSMNA